MMIALVSIIKSQNQYFYFKIMAIFKQLFFIFFPILYIYKCNNLNHRPLVN